MGYLGCVGDVGDVGYVADRCHVGKCEKVVEFGDIGEFFKLAKTRQMWQDW